MTNLRSRHITDLKQSEIRNRTCERLLRFRCAKEDAVLHEAADRL